MTKLTQEEWNYKRHEKHKDAYVCLDKYKGRHKKIRFKCKRKDHPIFLQAPDGHLAGKGCKLCGIERSAIKRSSKLKYEDIKKLALNYCTITEFRKENGGAYKLVLKNNWSKEIFSHMRTLGHIYKRAVYACIFPDKHIYIGITCNIERRYYEHILTDEKSSVYKHMKKFNTPPEFIILSEYIDATKAIKKETEYIEKYKILNYTLLNKSKAGSLGKYVKWDFKTCQTEALKYSNKTDFLKNSAGAYNVARLNGWLNNFCSHMKRPPTHNLLYTKEFCYKEIIKYKSKIDFIKYSWQCYRALIRNKWMDLLQFFETNL